VDPSSGSIVTLPDAACPDYAQNFGTCGTYSKRFIGIAEIIPILLDKWRGTKANISRLSKRNTDG